MVSGGGGDAVVFSGAAVVRTGLVLVGVVGRGEVVRHGEVVDAPLSSLQPEGISAIGGSLADAVGAAVVVSAVVERAGSAAAIGAPAMTSATTLIVTRRVYVIRYRSNWDDDPVDRQPA